METQERKLVVDQLAGSQARLLELVEGLTPAQWDFHESPERWSIAEVIEHVAAVDSRIVGMIEKRVEQPSSLTERPPTEGTDAMLLQAAVSRAVKKFSAPEAVHPKGKHADRAELLTEFHRARGRTIQFASDTGSDLRGHIIPHPVFGELDCQQWLVLLGQHGYRHALQIEEIKAHPAFPGQSLPAAV